MGGLFSARFVRVYIVPGAVFQSVMVGGGYGTGREIVEYFTSFGAHGGLLAAGVAFLVIAATLAASFELARAFRAYEYRGFIRLLLGRGWFVYEILVVLQFLLVLAVLASAAGSISSDSLEIPYGVGIAVLLLVIGVLTFYGRELVARALTFWSFFLYAVFIAFFVMIFSERGDAAMAQLDDGVAAAGWAVSGFQYGLYNVALVPLLLYVARDFRTRGEALGSGVVGAVIALFPAVVFHVAFLAAYPDVLSRDIPVYWLLEQYGGPFFLLLYSVMLFGTFIETGAGLLQGINERIDAMLVEKRGRGLQRGARAGIAVGAVLLSGALSLWGITALIARGYGTMAWVFLFIFILPLLTIGVWRFLTVSADKHA